MTKFQLNKRLISLRDQLQEILDEEVSIVDKTTCSNLDKEIVDQVCIAFGSLDDAIADFNEAIRLSK